MPEQQVGQERLRYPSLLLTVIISLNSLTSVLVSHILLSLAANHLHSMMQVTKLMCQQDTSPLAEYHMLCAMQ